MYHLYFDGCEDGCASILVKDGIEMNTIMIHSEMNSVESIFTALCTGLEYCIRKSITELVICGENYLIMKQLKGEDEMTHKLGMKTRRLLDLFKVQYKLIFRHENRRARQLAKEASHGI